MSSEQWTGISSPTVADKQPQSLIMQQSPHAGATCSHQLRCRSDLSDQSTHFPASPERWTLLRRYPEFRALQSQLSHLRIENEGLRRQLDCESRRDQRIPAELKWLIYFRAPASKAQVLAIVR